jgi:hypothetical protein
MEEREHNHDDAFKKDVAPRGLPPSIPAVRTKWFPNYWAGMCGKRVMVIDIHTSYRKDTIRRKWFPN